MPQPSPRAWGVLTRYTATGGERRTVPRATVRAILAAMGADPPAPRAEPGGGLSRATGRNLARGDVPADPAEVRPREVRPAEVRPGEIRPREVYYPGEIRPGELHPGDGGLPLVVIQGERREAGAGEVELEDGSVRHCPGRLPEDLPLGYHTLHLAGGGRPLIVTPPRCHLPRELRGFVLAVQLYAARSAGSWGIGDLRDLAEVGRWAAGLGASALVVSPVHAALPLPPVEPSPYFPTSRVFLNPLHLRPDGPPGLAERARRLNADRSLHRDEVMTLKMEALERAFANPGAPAAAERELRERPLLGEFALFCALAERHGRDWRAWPAPLAGRDPRALAAAAEELTPRIRFHAWMQGQLDLQMKTAGASLPLVHDLAVGVHPGGADAWMWQELLAPGISVGAPPDSFNTRGQDWGVPAFDPWKLRAAAYRPFIETLRAALGHGGGVRIDHVLGLERLWWIPAGNGPAEGAYVRYPVDDLLGIVALESVRHRALVIGEDLGTVPRGLRGRLRRRGLLGYVLLLFESRPARHWPRQAVAAVTTHDLPTVAGLWDGSDLAERRRLGLPADAAANSELARRVAGGDPGQSGLDPSAGVEAAVLHAHRRLAGSPCMLVSATLEDIALVRERPNQPGLTGPPSWSLGLPLPLEELETLPVAARLTEVLRARP